MNRLLKIALIAVTATALAACVRTVPTGLPSGAVAYERMAVPASAYPAEYQLRIGDRVDIKVLQEEDFSAEKAIVDTSGNVSIPMLGAVQAVGKTQDELAGDIRDRLAGSYLRDPRVSVLLETPAVQTVSVEGEVDQPGVYEIAPGSTLLTAVALARSPTERAKLDQVLIFRTVNGERLGARFDLAAIRSGRDPDPFILPDDVVVVGYSQVRGVFLDFLKSAPLLNIFTRY